MAGLLPEFKFMGVAPALQAYSSGMSDYRKEAEFARENEQRNLLKSVGQTAATQGLNAAGLQAMRGGDIATGIKLQDLSLDRQSKLFEFMGRGAAAADTPEKWAAFTATLAKTFGPESVRGFEDFRTRDSAIMLALSAKEQADLKLRQQGMALQERSVAATEKRANKDTIPSGFRATAEGNLAPIPGGPADPNYKRQITDKQNAPAGYKWVDPNNPDAGLQPIPGGPGEKVDAEVAARIGLGRSFLGQLQDYTDPKTGEKKPGIMPGVEAGEATGPIDYTVGKFGFGRSGALHRQIASGAEALLRNLTGAGMNKEEAADYVNRYRPSWRDDAQTLASKMTQLERELNSVMETVGRGRGGTPPPVGEKKPIVVSKLPSGVTAAMAISEAKKAIAEGKDRAFVVNRLKEWGVDTSGL